MEDSQGWETLRADQFRLPSFPRETVTTLRKITGGNCKWEVLESKTENGDRVIRIKIVSGYLTIAIAEGVRIRILQHGLPKSLKGHEFGWLSSIKVMEWAQGEGLGRLSWEAFDQVIKTLEGYEGQRALHIFVDLAGWGEKLLSTIPNKWKLPNASRPTYIYLV